MKTLILIRHAKSDWPENVADMDRPLAERGIKNARKMAKFLLKEAYEIDCLVTSPAKRTIETCEIFSDIFEMEYETEGKLYHPSEQKFMSVVLSVDDRFNSAAMFSHNNGISNFANSLSDEFIDFPTCGVAIFNVDIDEWSNFENADKKLIAFYKPKSI